MEAEKQERWEFMRPWCDELRGQIALTPWTDKTGAPTVTLPQHGDTDEFRKRREAVALLAAAAHVDREVWRALLGECQESEVGDVPVRFMLKMNMRARPTDDGIVHDLIRFCGAHQNDEPSAAYQETMKKIAALRGSCPGKEIKIPVRVKCQTSSAAVFNDVWSAERAIKEEWERSARNAVVAHGSLRCTFVLEPMAVELSEISTDTASSLEALLRNNLWLSSLSLSAEEWPDNRAADKTSNKLIASLFSSTRRSPEQASTGYHPGTNQQRVDSVDLYAPMVGFETIFSAIASSQSVRKLDLDLAEGVRRPALWWKYLAYAVFSKRSLSSLEAITLSFRNEIPEEEVEEFTSVVLSPYPLEDVFGYLHGQIQGQLATLAPGKPIWWPARGPDLHADNAEMLLFESQVVVQTFSDNGTSTWVNALLPGFGRSRVMRKDLILLENGVRSSRQGLTELSIHFDRPYRSTTQGLPRFLESIGDTLMQLTITKSYEEGDESQFLSCCPNLEGFVLETGSLDARLDFSGYRATNQSLPELKSTWDDVAAFANDLSDDTNPLAKCVRKLRVRLYFPDDDSRYGVALEALLKMLSVNNRLEYLEVVVPEGQEHEYPSRFKSHHLKPVWRTKEPLAVEFKAAFASVFSSKGIPAKAQKRECESPRTASLPHLDDTITSMIFDFAATPVLRQVRAQVSNRIDAEIGLDFDEHL